MDETPECDVQEQEWLYVPEMPRVLGDPEDELRGAVGDGLVYQSPLDG